MRFSLKLLLAIVLVFGVVGGWIGRNIRLNKPTPVSIRYEVVTGSPARSEFSYPKEMIMWRKPKLYRDMRAQAIAELYPTDDELLQQILADPTRYRFFEDRHVELVKQNRDKVLAGTKKYLDPKKPGNVLFLTARIRKELDDRSGFDILRKQFIEDHNSGLAHQLWVFPKPWWENDDAIKSGLYAGLNDPESPDKSSFVDGLKRFGDNQPLIEHLYQVAQKKGVQDYEIQSALEELAREDPSLGALELAREFAKTKTTIVEYQRANLLEPFCAAEDAEVRKRALAICERLSHRPTDVSDGENKYQRRREGFNFYEKVCTHGGAEYSDYFQRYAKEKRFDNAMRALARIWPRDKAAAFAKEHHYERIVTELLGEEAIPYLIKRMDEQPSTEFPRLMVQAANGKPNAAAAEAIEAFLKESDDDLNYYTGRELIYLLKKLGRDDADSLLSLLPSAPLPDNANQFWIQHDVDQQQLVSFLNSEKVGNPITLGGVLKQIEQNGLPVEEYKSNDLLAENDYEVRRFVFNALEASGVAQECDFLSRFDYVPRLVDLVNQWSLGETANKQTLTKNHRLWAAPAYEETKLNITFGKRVFEIPVEDEHPVFAAEALNSILADFTDHTKRFYVYIYYVGGWDDHFIAYLEPDVAKKLEEDFGLVAFPKF